MATVSHDLTLVDGRPELAEMLATEAFLDAPARPPAARCSQPGQPRPGARPMRELARPR
jgi:hypothetical protein